MAGRAKVACPHVGKRLQTPRRRLEVGLPVAAGVDVRAVLWDLDGTILDSKLSIRDSLNHVLRAHGHPTFTAPELDRLIGTPLRDILRAKVPEAEVEPLALRYRAAYNDIGWITAAPYPGVSDVLDAVRRRGLLQAVVTSKGQAETETMLVDIGLADLFDAVVGDDDVRPLKPHPAPVLEACRKLKVDPAEAVMVGDTTFDVHAAKGAGASAIGVLWGIHQPGALREAGADALARDPRHLRRILLP